MNLKKAKIIALNGMVDLLAVSKAVLKSTTFF
ncbi:hypothetical protein AVDCRST_MAG92-5227 [uncultured Coleofasciculus sp.]|uniref:Uncharacterized protein n=1 Tax=uncultured Coleofasciculus sp. TaxID=1267456 RepID=A0A6J4KDS6_9CYAN|nr:hypothetical protein AVDCRST_MAG92-5227 [uncultured Coleofasciculus sp.]